jgi:TIGR01777 family protein
MRILLSGSSGLVGSALTPLLQGRGDELATLVREKSRGGKNEIYWQPNFGSVDKPAIEDFAPDAVVHLAGEPIAKGRWNPKKKQLIKDSRVLGTQALANSLANLSRPPKVLICASAVGYYGTRGDECLTEQSPRGEGFLPEVCAEWEAACQPARDKGIRVVNLRFGMVLSPKGGALKKLLTPFKLGLGGVLGNGRQYMSWIALDDVVQVILFALQNDKLSGAVNTVAPQAVTNREFTKTLGRVMWRPTLFPLPASTARMLFGEMADALLLASTRAVPERLGQAGYAFQFPDLKPALKHLLR